MMSILAEFSFEDIFLLNLVLEISFLFSASTVPYTLPSIIPLSPISFPCQNPHPMLKCKLFNNRNTVSNGL